MKCALGLAVLISAPPALLCAAGATNIASARTVWTPREPLIGEAFDKFPGMGFPDPRIFRDSKDYYLCGTGTRIYRTRSFEPRQLRPYDLALDYGAETPLVKGVWAVTLYRHTDGAFHLYATLHHGGFNTSVAHFLPQPGERWAGGAPVTRWRLDKVLVNDAYDSNAVRDDQGKLYLVYNGNLGERRDSRHVMAQRMLDPARLDPAFPPRALLSPEGFRSEDRDRHRGYQLVEGTAIQRVGGKYVLFYSVGDFAASNYKLGVAFSDRLIPPAGSTYRKVLAPDPADLWGSGRGEEVLYLLQTEKADWPNYWGAYFDGPGIGSLVTIGGRALLVFHARRADVSDPSGGHRYTWAMPVTVNIAANRPMKDWVQVPCPPPKRDQAKEHP